ncbi:MAG: hypothetical protein IJ574_04180 [Bacilli bacterium]|nr:hypothetical protein [Bacilli bacterium]
MNEVYKCCCSMCHKISYVNEDNLYPGIDYNKKGEGFLVFQIQCPECLALSNVNLDDIPNDIKLSKMQEYAGFINKMKQVLIIDRMIKELDEYKHTLIDEIDIIKNDRDINHLYSNWQDNEFVLEHPDNPSGNKKKKYHL